MPKSAFVDTTVLANALLKPTTAGKPALAALKRYDDKTTPTYALKEFQLGPLRGYVWLHNALLVNSITNTFGRIAALSRGLQRNLTSTALEALTEASAADPLKSNRRDPDQARHQVHAYRLATKGLILRAWIKRRRIANVLFPLECYAEEPPIEDHRGVLSRGTACPRAARCSLAAELKSRLSDVQRVHTALVSLNSTRREDQKRARALKEFMKRPQAGLSDDQCRAVGDAVFAILCPAGSEILTTNTRDHEPLAAALGKRVGAPPQ